MFTCRYASYQHQHTDSEQMLRHILLQHANDSHFKMQCFHPRCAHIAKRYRMLEKHVRSLHSPRTEESIAAKSIQCDMPNCDTALSNIDELYTHYYAHIKRNFENKLSNPVRCFYKECNYRCNTDFTARSVSNFRNHLTKAHMYDKQASNLREELREPFNDNGSDVPMSDSARLALFSIIIKCETSFLTKNAFYFLKYIKKYRQRSNIKQITMLRRTSSQLLRLRHILNEEAFKMIMLNEV